MRGSSDIDDRQVTPVQPVGQPGGGDRGDRRGIGEHEPDPRRRQHRVDRQISRPGLEHRQNRHDRLGRTRKQQRHTRTRAHTMGGQQVRQPVSGLLQLAIRPRTLPAADRHRLGGARHLCGEQHRNRHRRVAGWVNTARLPHPSSRACSPASSRSIDDNRRAGSAVIATNTRSNRPAKSETSKFENGPPAPAVPRKSWSPTPEKINPKPPTRPELVYVADAVTPPKSTVNRDGTKLTLTLSAGCPGPRALRSRACTGNL